MSQPSRKSAAATVRRPRKQRLRFIAAVRFADGSCERFSIDNANDHEDARRMIFAELTDVAAVVIADYQR